MHVYVHTIKNKKLINSLFEDNKVLVRSNNILSRVRTKKTLSCEISFEFNFYFRTISICTRMYNSLKKHFRSCAVLSIMSF